MLFINEKLKSVYDFEHSPDEIKDDKANIVALGNEIERRLAQLCERIGLSPIAVPSFPRNRLSLTEI